VELYLHSAVRLHGAMFNEAPTTSLRLHFCETSFIPTSQVRTAAMFMLLVEDTECHGAVP
jgi:hypothetical protein